MSRQTKLGIGWCDYTFNLWEGCWKVSPGCENCYAEAKNKWLKQGEHWGRTAPRDFFKAAHYDQPLKWNDRARDAGERHTVFCGSVMDIMEIHPIAEINERMNRARRHLWNLLEVCESLDFLLLTKRIENAPRILPWIELKCEPPRNAFIGTTVEDEPYANKRLSLLKAVPAYRRFVSYEPAIGAITNWREHLASKEIHQVIFGDESGRKRRPAEEAWAAETRDACAETGTAFYYKQWHGKDGKKIHLPVLDGRSYREFPAP